MRSSSLAFLAMLAPVAIAAGSCALSGFTIQGSGGSSGSSSSASGAGGGDAGKCGVTYPDPPVKAVDGGDYDIVAALHTINFGDKGTVGLDLDRLCTCHGDGPSCTGTKMACDDDQGRDNAAAGLLNALTIVLKAGNFGSDFYSSMVNDGAWSLLIRVRDYNGEVNDAQVEVDWYVSTGFSMKGISKPLWDGSDKWDISGGSVNAMDLNQPKYKDVNAYVSDSMLVASLPDAEVTLSGGTNTMTIHFTGAGLLAKLVPDVVPMQWKLTDGQLLGRWKLSEVFKSLSSYRSPAICTTNAFYGTAKGYICGSADILSGLGTPATPCDALSIGLGFTADVANLGKVVMPAPPTPGCPDGGDPANDSCP